jgi:hypothetical protein
VPLGKAALENLPAVYVDPRAMQGHVVIGLASWLEELLFMTCTTKILLRRLPNLGEDS